jgi:hypothetical protein
MGYDPRARTPGNFTILAVRAAKRQKPLPQAHHGGALARPVRRIIQSVAAVVKGPARHHPPRSISTHKIFGGLTLLVLKKLLTLQDTPLWWLTARVLI